MNRLIMRRLAALLIDYVVILCIGGIVACASIGIYFLNGSQFPDYLGLFGPLGTQALFFVVLTLPVGLYLYKTEASDRHATLGKRCSKLTIMSINASAVSKRQIAVRTVIKLLPWEAAHFFTWQLQYKFYVDGYDAQVPFWIMAGLTTVNLLIIVYVCMVVFRRDGRGPHDLAAETKVYMRS